MDLKSDLSKCEIGDWVCTAEFGWVKVEGVHTGFLEIETESCYCKAYHMNGREFYHRNKYPTCFPIGQVPQPYLDIFGPPPCEFKDGDPVWFSNDKVHWYAGVFKKPEILRFKNGVSKQIYYMYSMCSGCSDWFEYCAPWDNGVPPKEE